MLRRVFVSYSSTDAARVRGLADDMQSLGYDVWYDHELTGGQRWWDQILAELRACDVLVFAVSAAAVDSRACFSELEYAQRLEKPVLPVMIERDFAESMLPPVLAELQRIDYTTEDKRALASLNRALNGLPEAPPLPEVLPDPPPVPASYLFDLKTAIDEVETMTVQRQDEILAELRNRLKDGYPRADLLALAHRFRRRDDLLVRVDRDLVALEEMLEAEAGHEVAVLTPPPAASISELSSHEEAKPPGFPRDVGPEHEAQVFLPASARDVTPAPGVSFNQVTREVVGAIQLGFRHYFNFRDRSTRPEYWYWVLFAFLITTTAEVMDLILGTALLQWIASVGLVVPSVAVGVRRLHDIGRSGWNLLWTLTIVGGFYVLYLLVQPSEGPNRYGSAALSVTPS